MKALIDLRMYLFESFSGADYFCGAGALLVELVLFAYHLHGRTLLSTHLHTILIYIIALQTISTIAELMNQQNFIWSLPR